VIGLVEAYPLCWPDGKQRIEHRQLSRFDTSFAVARDNCYNQIRMLGGKNIVISTNIPLRRDGLPYAVYSRRHVDDPGVAVYFDYKGDQKCFCCDKWVDAGDNIHAVGKTIEALRGISRWGTGDMVDAAFRGFDALPPHTHEDTVFAMSQVDYFTDCNTAQDTRARKRSLSREMHPDKGGNPDEFMLMIKQFERKMKEFV